MMIKSVICLFAFATSLPMNPAPADEAVEAVSTYAGLKSLGKKALDKLASHLTPQESFGRVSPTEDFAGSAMQASRQPTTAVNQKLDGTLGSTGFSRSQVGMGMVAPARPIALQRMEAFRELPESKMSKLRQKLRLAKLGRPAFLTKSSVSVDSVPIPIPRPAPLERTKGFRFKLEEVPITKLGLNSLQVQELRKQGFSNSEINTMKPKRYFELMKKRMAAVSDPNIPLEAESLPKSGIPILKGGVPDRT